MPLYSFQCENNHVQDTVYTVDSIPDHPTEICRTCGMEARRLFLSAGRGIIRPKGWSLKPDEPGYADLPREAQERYVKEWYKEHHLAAEE